MDRLVIAKYIRLSVDEAHTGSYSIENQRLLLDQYLLDSDLDGEVLEFVDNGYSGINFERPAVQEMLELVREGKIHCILVKDFSRFGRDALETGYFIERVFPLFRVRFISVSDHFDSSEHEGGAGGMEVSFKFLVNECYSRDLSVKIRSAKREKALRGELVTKNCVYGYMLDEGRRMVIDSPAAAVVRRIFEMYAAKHSLADIAGQLCGDGVPVPAVWKQHLRKADEGPEFRCVWQKTVVLSILQNEQYLGTYVAGKRKVVEVGSSRQVLKPEEDWVRIPGHHPAIIEQALWDAAQAQLGVKGEPLRKREPNATKRYAKQMATPLKGKVVCGCCGHVMRVSATKNAAFQCCFTLPAPDADCHRLHIPKSELEDVVLKSIRRQAKAVLKAGLHAADVQAVCAPAAEEHMARIEGLKEGKRRLYEAMVSGGITADEYKAQKAAMDAELENAVRVHGAILGECKKNIPGADAIAAARQAMKGKKLTEALVDLLVENVLVWPGNKIEIVWKLDGFMDCLALDEMEGLRHVG